MQRLVHFLKCTHSAVRGVKRLAAHLPRNRRLWRSTMNTTKYFVLRLMATLLSVACCAAAQTSTTSLQGTVTDPTGGAVANAKLELLNVDSKAQRDTTTDSQGEYRFQSLSPGNYSLTVSAAGFARFERTGLQLMVNTPATATAQLQLC